MAEHEVDGEALFAELEDRRERLADLIREGTDGPE